MLRRLFRAQFAGGLGVLAVLAGWSFDVTLRNVTALVVLLAAQLSSVAIASAAFRRREDGPLLGSGCTETPVLWSIPVAVATLGAEAAVFVAAYDMLTQPRVAVGITLMRRAAPDAQAPRTALTDYAPTAGAVLGLLAWCAGSRCI